MARRPREDVHDALLDAAREEFARSGFEHARVEDVARRAGISKGAFYLHFRTKDDAFREMIQRLFGALEDHSRRRHEMEERLREKGARAPRPGSEAFEAECASDVELLELLWRNRQIVAAIDRASRSTYRELLAGFRRRIRGTVVERIQQRQRLGALRPEIDPEVVGDLVVGTYEGFARRMAEMKARPDLAAWARSLLAVLYEGILAPCRAIDPDRRGEGL